MKILSAILTAAALIAATTAQAQKFDLSSTTCKQFLGLEQSQIGIVVIWLSGFYTEEDADPIVDLDKIKKNADKLVAYCNKNPDATMVTAAEEAFEN